MTIEKPSFFKSFYPYNYGFSRFDRETQFSKGFPVDEELIHPGKKNWKTISTISKLRKSLHLFH